MSLQNSHVGALTLCVAVFGDGASKEVITVKGDHRLGSLSDRISVLMRGDSRELALHSPGKPCEEDIREKAAVCCLPARERGLTGNQL